MHKASDKKLGQATAAYKHVIGETKFIDDVVSTEGQLVLKIVASTVAKGKIVKVDYQSALKIAGVVDILDWKSIPGENNVGHIAKDQPLLAVDQVNHFGEPILLICAENEAAAEQALKAVKIEYKPEIPILSIEDALAAHSLFAEPAVFTKGDISAGFKSAEHVLEGEISCGSQEHFYLETQATRAVKGEGNQVLIYASTQSPEATQSICAEILGLPFHEVVVEVNKLGGAFGGKESASFIYSALAALACFKLKRTAQLRLNREEDVLYTGKRHPFLAKYKVGFDKKGKILAYDLNLSANGGAYLDLSLAILARAMFHADNCYELSNVRITGQAVKTNLPPNTAFRGFGAPQGAFVIENVVERIAEVLKKDSLKIRELNFYKKGDITPFGQTIKEFFGKKSIEGLKKRVDLVQLKKEIKDFNLNNKYTKMGYAIVPIKFGISFTTTFLNQGTALVWVYTDGSVSVSHGGIEMGQGLNLKLNNIVARIFGIHHNKIKIETTSTQRTANSSSTAASSGADLNGNAVRIACEQVQIRLAKFAATLFTENTLVPVNPKEVIFKDDLVSWAGKSFSFAELVKKAYLNRVNLGAQGYYRTPEIHFDLSTNKGNPFYYFVHGACLAKVKVDLLNGYYKIEQAHIVHETAKSLDSLTDIGQIAGAFVQGTGWMTMEELPWDKNGKYLANSPSTYKIPAITDMPENFDIVSDDFNAKHTSVFGSKGIGEPPLLYGIAVYMAIRNALCSLTDKPENIQIDAPITAEKIVMNADLLRRNY